MALTKHCDIKGCQDVASELHPQGWGMLQVNINWGESITVDLCPAHAVASLDEMKAHTNGRHEQAKSSARIQTGGPDA